MSDRNISHPNPQVKANNPHAQSRAIRARHAATLATIPDLIGKKMTPELADMLAALQAALGNDGPVNDACGYLIESGLAAARLRRQQPEATA